MAIVMELYTIAIRKNDSSEPALYYNPYHDRWQELFQFGCGYASEEEANEKFKEINVEGAYVVKGTVGGD